VKALIERGKKKRKKKRKKGEEGENYAANKEEFSATN